MTEVAEPRKGLDLQASIPEDAAPLEAILCTEELRRRPSRPAQFESENRALTSLVSALADSPRTILQTLADTVLEVLDADSAGLSLLTKDETRFYWAAISGAWGPHSGGGTPRGFGPCGDVLDRCTPMLFTHWERRYPYLNAAIPLAEEGLLVPFYVNGKAVGTIWAIAHDQDRRFDAEDLRLLESLGRFASAAHQAVTSIDDLKFQIAEREKAESSLRELADSLEMRVRLRTEELEQRNAEVKKLQDQLCKENIALREEIEKGKRTEDALRRSQLYLSEGQRLAHTGSWAFNPSGFFDYWSPELFRIYGLDPVDGPPTLEKYLATIHPQDRQFMAETVETMVAERSSRDVKKRVVRPDGTLRHVRCVSAPVLDGKVLKGFVGTAMDVTEQEELTQLLRRRQAYLAEAQRLSRTGSFGWSIKSGEIVWSDETFRIFECDRDTKPTVGLVLERTHPEDKALVQDQIDRAFREGKDFDFEHRLLLPSDCVKHVHVVSHALREESGGFEFVGAVMDVTAAKQVEDRIRLIINTVPGLHWSARPDGWVNFINQRWLDYTGMTLEQALGWGWAPAYHPDELAQVLVAWRAALTEGKPLEMETRLRRFDGEYRWFLERVFPLFDSVGHILGWYGSDIDIQDKKQAEEKLRQSEAYLAEAQRLSRTGSWAWSPDTDVRYWSEECYRVLGFDPRDGLPRIEELIQRIHPDDQAAFRESARRAAHGKLDQEVNYRIVHPGGAVRDIHSIGHPVFNPRGDLIEYTGTVIDITERKRAEEELQQLVDLVPQLIAVAGPDGNFIHVNRMTREYTGLTLEEFRSIDFISRVVHPDDQGKVRAERKRGFLGIDPFEYEARLLGKEGVYRWFLLRYNALVEEGRARRWYGTATEIESRRQEEERVRQENVRLEERTRIAQELHDTLLQSFCAATMKLGAAMDALPSNSLVKPKLDPIVQLMEQGLAEGRTAIQGLRSSDSGTSDLVVSLSGIQQELVVQPDVDFRVTVVGLQKPLRAPIREEIYRIGREALVNAFSHSRAKSVELELEYNDSNLSMRVRDNGCGIDPQMLDKGREAHWGLAGMRERAAKIGGLLKISSSATAGTEIQLSIPSDVAIQLSPGGSGQLRTR